MPIEVARVSAEEARRQVAIATALACLTLVSQHRSLDVLERAGKNASDHLVFSRSRYAGGVSTRLDPLRAAKEVSTEPAQLPNASTTPARASASPAFLGTSERQQSRVDRSSRS